MNLGSFDGQFVEIDEKTAMRSPLLETAFASGESTVKTSYGIETLKKIVGFLEGSEPRKLVIEALSSNQLLDLFMASGFFMLPDLNEICKRTIENKIQKEIKGTLLSDCLKRGAILCKGPIKI